MRRLSTTAAVLIAAVLALLLVAYVFFGDALEREQRPSDQALKERCSSQQTYDLIKRELFRRAAAVRRSGLAALTPVADYSVLRMEAPVVQGYDEARDAVACAGSVVLDLPPGVAVIGGRRRLGANIAYALQLKPDGSGQLVRLSNADAIVTPLATVGPTGKEIGDLLAPPSETGEAGPPAEGATSELPREAAPAQAAARAAPAEPPQRPRPAQTRAPSTVAQNTTASARPAAPKARPPEPRVPQRTTAPRPAPAAPVQAAGARPSFNCRFARTRGEVAVCGDPALASLDRQMATQFYRSMSAATPAQRALLQRTRSRFLSYRDSCGSVACMAETYRGRMREINDIMAGRWRPPQP